jgi:predicted Fe-Mo cluster-binding NifX family protein
MKIAVATRNFSRIARHAGQTHDWLVYDGRPDAPVRITLDKAQLPHHFRDEGPHPLDGVAVIVAGSAGDGFVRRMAKRGTQVRVTGETDPRTAAEAIFSGSSLKPPRFNPGTLLCKIHDLFSIH